MNLPQSCHLRTKATERAACSRFFAVICVRSILNLQYKVTTKLTIWEFLYSFEKDCGCKCTIELTVERAQNAQHASGPLLSSAYVFFFQITIRSDYRADVHEIVGNVTASDDVCCVWQCVAVCGSVWQCVAGCCRVLQCVAVCCSVLHCAAVCCTVLQCVAVCCTVMQCVAVCCTVLQCVAVCCTVLQCVAVCCTVLQCVAVCCTVLQCVAVWCTMLQCVAVCCSVLQCVAVRCSVLRNITASDTLPSSSDLNITHFFNVQSWLSDHFVNGIE